MNLFDLPESQPDRLTLARRRYADAIAALDAAEAASDELGTSCSVAHHNLEGALTELEAAELAAIGK